MNFIKPKFLLLITIILLTGRKNISGQQVKLSIDLVFCLDLSGSTNGLIDDVRDSFWDIINQNYSFRPQPELRIGVVAFSRPSFKRETGYVKILAPLSNYYEPVAYELSQLKPSIEKGDQLVGHALKAATLGMGWSKDEGTLKVIFLIGNGHVNLDGDKYKEAYAYASEKKIIVNTIYCKSSNYIEEISGWMEIAKQTRGEQFEMQVHKRNPLILTCKETDSLHQLGKKLIQTYIYYGKHGKEIYKMQEAIDKTALRGNEMTYQSRLFYKVSDLYQLKQGGWDLVDYLKTTNSDFQDLNPSWLPDSLQSYKPVSLHKLVMAKKDQRLKIISDIRALLKFDRQQIINKQIREKEYDKHPVTFDRIIISWLNRTAAARGIHTFVN